MAAGPEVIWSQSWIPVVQCCRPTLSPSHPTCVAQMSYSPIVLTPSESGMQVSTKKDKRNVHQLNLERSLTISDIQWYVTWELPHSCCSASCTCLEYIRLERYEVGAAYPSNFGKRCFKIVFLEATETCWHWNCWLVCFYWSVIHSFLEYACPFGQSSWTDANLSIWRITLYLVNHAAQ